MNEARVNVTYNGVNSDLAQSVDFDATDRDIKQWAKEAIETDSVPGMEGIRGVDLNDFVVDRFVASTERRALLMIRAKTPFGTCGI